MPGVWKVWIDTGGTFTDCLAIDPDGATHRAKVLSTSALRGRIAGVGARGDILFVEQDWNAPARFIDGMRVRVPGVTRPDAEPRAVGFDPEGGAIRIDRPLAGSPPAGAMFEAVSGEEAPILAARLVTRTPPDRALPPIEMRLGTTRGTNALLERTGAPVALYITRGFADLLEIGTQQRPDLFALRIVKPPMLYAAVVEVPERLNADGSVLRPLDLSGLEAPVRRLVAEGVRSASVALLHSWLNPEHERALETFLRLSGFEHVSCSADLSPTIKILPRAETAVVNAYLAPVIEGYLGRVSASLSGIGLPGDAAPPGRAVPRLHIMTSAGGLFGAPAFRPKDSLLSGPAGGVAGAAAAAARSGLTRVIAFDMGGTSTDVARIEDGASGEYEYRFEHQVGPAHIAAPALAIESVAAGGGSVCWFDGDGLQVGPRSAGAEPGPACYGSGGPLTITDVNLLLGRLDPSRFGVPIDDGPARRRLGELIGEVGRLRTGVDADGVLNDLLAIACDRMAEAIRRISVQRGFDPAEYALVAFGGAGPQHACRVAETLGISTVLVPADAGLLCCLGLGHATVERFAERQVLRPLDECASSLPALLDELGERALRALAEDTDTVGGTVRRRIVHLRLAGQESTLGVEWTSDLRGAFEARYRVTYGHAPERRAVEVESVRVAASSGAGEARPRCAAAPPHSAEPPARRRAWFDGKWIEAPAFDRALLAPGAAFGGPAIVAESHSATVVEGGWTCRVDGAGAMVLERAGEHAAIATQGRGHGTRPLPPEIASARLASIATEMGEMLRRTALSVNVKERLDFSCALLDADGRLVVNAPHIPVHLGALGVCVRALRERIEMGPGDTVITNHPAIGGSHLPDVTVVTPVHAENGALLAFVASRAHHAEIGGIRPGSMPFDAKWLAEEGVVIPAMHLVRGGEGRWDKVRAVLAGGPFPSRAVDDNLADLRAQLAANQRGADGVREFVSRHGGEDLRSAMAGLTERARRRTREALGRVRERAHGIEVSEASLPGPRSGLHGDPSTSASDTMNRLGLLEAVERLDDGTALRVRMEFAPPGGTPMLRADFTGTGGVHALGLNATPAIVRSAVMYVLRLLVDEALPLNEGLLDGVEIIVPRGLLDPEFPDDPARCPPVAAGNTETSQRLVDVLLKALEMCSGSQGTMNNVAFGNEGFGYYETICGGAGAAPGFDGASAVHTHMTNTRITDPEVLERRYPVRLERFAIRRGSGGTGRWKGGDGVEREFVFLEPCSLSILSQHRAEGPYALAGAQAGTPGAQWLVHADGTRHDLPAIAGAEVRAGDRLIIQTPGGGGYGLRDATADAPADRSRRG